LGADLATAAGVAANEKDGTERVRQLMLREGVNPENVDKYAGDIYKAVKEFIDNTQFCVPLYKPKY